MLKQRWRGLLFLGGLAALIPLVGDQPYLGLLYQRGCVAAMGAISLQLCRETTGELSLGQGAFVGIGGYAAAFFTKQLVPLGGAGCLLGIAGGIGIAFLVGLISGLPLLRLRGDYFSVATMGLGETLRVGLDNAAFLGGSGGYFSIPKYSSPLFALLGLGAILLTATCYRNSQSGLLARAAADDPLAADSIGISSGRTKLLSFALSAGIAGASGAILAGSGGFLSPSDFTFARSVDLAAATVLGRSGILSAGVAAVGLELASALLAPMAQLRSILYGLILVGGALLGVGRDSGTSFKVVGKRRRAQPLRATRGAPDEIRRPAGKAGRRAAPASLPLPLFLTRNKIAPPTPKAPWPPLPSHSAPDEPDPAFPLWKSAGRKAPSSVGTTRYGSPPSRSGRQGSPPYAE
ncbi:MAG: branched-chain amino acid ABC transporter permease [Ruminococcaceae bacterium]|nr:branched-chain amino acid ABC transporter permease [Oscillospiraceae bacterium]